MFSIFVYTFTIEIKLNQEKSNKKYLILTYNFSNYKLLFIILKKVIIFKVRLIIIYILRSSFCLSF